MTPPKKESELKKKPGGYLKAVHRHEFRERRFSRQESYLQLMREAKAEFDAAEKRHKARKKLRKYEMEQPSSQPPA